MTRTQLRPADVAGTELALGAKPGEGAKPATGTKPATTRVSADLDGWRVR
jgi:hypothetical protein